MSDDLFEAGLQVRKDVLGAEYVENSLAKADDFMMAFQDYVTKYCWGNVWTREGLSRRDRSNEEITEVLLQVAVYAGVPASLSAFKAVHEVLKQEGRV